MCVLYVWMYVWGRVRLFGPQTKKELSEEITHLGDTISEKAEKLQFDFLNLFSRKGVLVRESPLLS